MHSGNAFLAALDAAETGGNVPDAWEPIFDARAYTSVAPLQFAITGLNAHVNRDLAHGLCAGWIAADGEPEPTGPRAQDYRRLNDLVAAALDEVKPWLLTGAVSGLDRALGTIDDRVALWRASAGLAKRLGPTPRALAPARALDPERRLRGHARSYGRPGGASADSARADRLAGRPRRPPHARR